MQTYLAQFTIYDGVHEHNGAFLLSAESYKEAEEIAQAEEHDAGIEDEPEPRTYFDYGDGTTSARLYRVTEVTPQEAITIHRLGLAYYLKEF